jgi:hypothetical protein
MSQPGRKGLPPVFAHALVNAFGQKRNFLRVKNRKSATSRAASPDKERRPEKFLEVTSPSRETLSAVLARRAAFDIRMSDFFRSQLGSINLGSSFLFKIMVGAKRFHLFINLNKKQEGFL